MGLLVAVPGDTRAGQKQDVPAVKMTRDVFVTQSSSGEELHGKLLELSPQTLSMLVDGRRVDLPFENVVRIDVRGDSVKNGTIIGALVFGGLCAITCGQGASHPSPYLTLVAINTGLGALIGAGIDGMNEGRSTIYRKPALETQAPTRGLTLVRLRF